MIFAVLLEDNDDFAEMRPKYMAQHLTFLTEHADRIEAAGPLNDAADGRPAGGLWVVTAQTAEEVRSLVETDPFWPTGLRKSVRIMQWRQVFNSSASTQ